MSTVTKQAERVRGQAAAFEAELGFPFVESELPVRWTWQLSPDDWSEYHADEAGCDECGSWIGLGLVEVEDHRGLREILSFRSYLEATTTVAGDTVTVRICEDCGLARLGDDVLSDLWRRADS